MAEKKGGPKWEVQKSESSGVMSGERKAGPSRRQSMGGRRMVMGWFAGVLNTEDAERRRAVRRITTGKHGR